MAMNFNELSGVKQWLAVVTGGALVTAALYFTVFKSQIDKNATAQKAVAEKVRENNELESYRPKLKDMERQLASLKQQLEIERKIVPDDKQLDTFIETMGGEAQKAGVELSLPSPSVPNRRIYFLAVNHANPILGRNPALRLAIAHAINREAILNACFRAELSPAPHRSLNGPYPPASWAFNPELKAELYNLGLAKGEAGRAKEGRALLGRLTLKPVSYTHLRAHETPEQLVCRLLLEKKQKNTSQLTYCSCGFIEQYVMPFTIWCLFLRIFSRCI